jgi:hypothetical protein
MLRMHLYHAALTRAPKTQQNSSRAKHSLIRWQSNLGIEAGAWAATSPLTEIDTALKMVRILFAPLLCGNRCSARRTSLEHNAAPTDQVAADQWVTSKLYLDNSFGAVGP